MREKALTALASIWLIVFVAAGVRVAYAWEQQRVIPGQVLLMRFQQETGNIAYSLAVGKGFSSPFRRETGPTAWLSPVYPLLVAGIFRIFGIETLRSFFAAAAMNIVFSAAACLPIFYAGKRIAGLGAASAAAWFWALLPNAVTFPFEWIWDTSLSALLAAALLWATLEIAESPRPLDWCAYGLLWGLALLTNPALGAALPFLLGWAAYRAYRVSQAPQDRGRGSGWARLQGPALAAACAILCCLPWTIRNYAAFHRFVPLRSNLGVELYVENNENYGDHPPVWPYQITREREIYRFFRMGEAAFMQEEMHKALQFIFTHPRVELGLFGERMVAFWMGTASPLRDFLSTDSLFLRAVFVFSFILTVGTIAGIAALFLTGSEYTFPLAVFPAAFPLVYYVTHASLRFRHVIDPILVLLSAIAAAGLLRLVSMISKPKAGPKPKIGPSQA